MNKIKPYLFLFIFSFMVIGSSVLSSCKKYEEGPGFTLRTAKSRVVNAWVIEKYLVNGDDLTAFWLYVFGEHAIVFHKNKSYEFIRNGSHVFGNWYLRDNRENLVIKELGITGTPSYSYRKIKKLTRNEMWLLYDDGTDKIEVHYKTK
jgi:hypothetical protein